MKKYISGIIACLVAMCPMTSFAISVNLNLLDGNLSILDSLLLIAVGIMIIGFLLICIALFKPAKVREVSETEEEFEDITDKEVQEPAAYSSPNKTENTSAEAKVETESEPANDVVHIKLTLTGVNNGDYKIAPLRDRTTFGRRKTNDVIFSDISISGEHGIITVEKNKIYIMDNDSTNGTYINGERIREKTEIHKGDIITLGQMEYRIGF